jgi:hypothetical protein
VGVPGPGQLTLKGKGIKRTATSADAAGRVRLLVKPKHKVSGKLKRRGKAKVKPKVTYTPAGGNPETKSTKLTLKRTTG